MRFCGAVEESAKAIITGAPYRFIALVVMSPFPFGTSLSFSRPTDRRASA